MLRRARSLCSHLCKRYASEDGLSRKGKGAEVRNAAGLRKQESRSDT
jgi:hypothetical protein